MLHAVSSRVTFAGFAIPRTAPSVGTDRFTLPLRSAPNAPYRHNGFAPYPSAIDKALCRSRMGVLGVQDMIWIGVSLGFLALGLVYVALADKA